MLGLEPETTAAEWLTPLTIATPENERMVRRYVAALSRDPAAVDDLAQEVFTRAIEHLDGRKEVYDAARFLRGIARNVVREHFRSERRDRRYVQATLESMVAQGDPVATRCHHQAMLESLQREVEELPLVSRRLIEMRYHDGLSGVQIGRSLGMSPQAVRITLMRIRQRLRRRLD